MNNEEIMQIEYELEESRRGLKRLDKTANRGHQDMSTEELDELIEEMRVLNSQIMGYEESLATASKYCNCRSPLVTTQHTRKRP